MRSALLAATAFFSLATISQTAFAADEAPYVDDRSDAAAVVRSLYSAINRHEFARAWGYYGDTKPAKDFDTFVKGYDGTDKVDVETGAVSDEGAAGSIYYSVPVAIRATGKDRNTFCLACFTGKYPLPVDPELDKFIMEKRENRAKALAEEKQPTLFAGLK